MTTVINYKRLLHLSGPAFTVVSRDGKMFPRASNAGVNFLLARVKFVPNFTLFCRKSELCHDFALLGGTC